jgi:phage host-nuclease inhibitor protein Gam
MVIYVFEEEVVSAGGSEWLEKVKRFLRDAGVRFEAEESVRIHVGDVVAEVSEREGGFVVTLSVEVPTTLNLEDVDRYANAYRDMLKMIAKAGKEPRYELDTSIGYPFLRAVIELGSIDDVLEMLKKMLS